MPSPLLAKEDHSHVKLHRADQVRQEVRQLNAIKDLVSFKKIKHPVWTLDLQHNIVGNINNKTHLKQTTNETIN